MEEETLTSFAIRKLLISGKPGIRSICAPLFTQKDKSICKYFPLVNNDIKIIYADLISTYGADYLIEKHTLIPLYRPIAYPHATAVVKSMLTMEISSLTRGIARICFNPKETVSNNLKYCPSCFIEQINNFGFCWFKREWLIHTMTNCLQHKHILLSVICNCGNNKNIIDSIKSAFRGVCYSCDRNQWVFDDYECDYFGKDNYTPWISNFLNAELPFFSRSLQLKLISTSVNKLMELNLDSYWGRTPGYLFDLYTPLTLKYPASGYFFWRNLWEIPIQPFLDSYFHPINERPTYLAELFFLISLAFPDFNEFVIYLNSIGTLSNREVYVSPEDTGYDTGRIIYFSEFILKNAVK